MARASARLEGVTEPIDIAIKVETHNHPTAISPFPGAATGSGGLETGERALTDEVAFKFSERAEHMEYELTRWGTRIDLLGERSESDATPLEVVS